jgi:hypothetical protein
LGFFNNDTCRTLLSLLIFPKNENPAVRISFKASCFHFTFASELKYKYMEKVMIQTMTQDNPVVVFYKQNDFFRKLKNCIPEAITLVEKQKMRLLMQEARMNPISCVVLHAEQDIPDRVAFEQFRERFPSIPWIVVNVM